MGVLVADLPAESRDSSLFGVLQDEATFQRHRAAVTKSMSNCIRLQLYSSERLSLSGWLCEATRRRAHTGTHTDARARTQRHTCARALSLSYTHTDTRAHTDTHAHAHARWINSKHGQSQRYRDMQRESKSKKRVYLERFVVGSLITIHSLISPNLLK